MSWDRAQLVELQSESTPGFWYSNLSRDGRGRVAFGGGHCAHLSPKNVHAFSTSDSPVLRAREQVAFVHYLAAELTSEVLLFVAVETNPPSIEVFLSDTPSAAPTRSKDIVLDSSHRGASITCMDTVAADGGPLLAVGLSTGKIVLFSRKAEMFRQVCELADLALPIISVKGDSSRHRSVLAACDESGRVLVWDEAGTNKFKLEHSIPPKSGDFPTALAVQDENLYVGHFSGRLHMHSLDSKRKVAEVVTNTRCITAIDAHPREDLLVVAGEDCRASILVPPRKQSPIQLIFSVCVNGMITGAVFTCDRPESAGVSLAIFERNYIVRYNFRK
mmetsp:Transcript_450/g.1561  ORF Transcript_450/g.1561 Transcript_450/m.1561 type:complete len:332 (+) Transcript_450:312-1307(+)